MHEANKIFIQEKYFTFGRFRPLHLPLIHAGEGGAEEDAVRPWAAVELDSCPHQTSSE